MTQSFIHFAKSAHIHNTKKPDSDIYKIKIITKSESTE